MSDKKYHCPERFLHGQQEKLGILLVNLGSPSAPTTRSVRKYLAEFLWDPRVVETARPLWWLILHGIILRFRPKRSAKAYKKVWQKDGSPLITISYKQAYALDKQLQKDLPGNALIEVAMRYGKPSIATALQTLRKAGMQRLLVLPMYPQYSATTTAAVFDAVTDELQNWRRLPEMRFINHYHDHPLYIKALVSSIRQSWRERKTMADKLVFSFHGIPQSYIDAGDPYFCHSQKTARLVAEQLKLEDSQWLVVFQSRMGREPWLQPYCDKTLQQLAENGTKSVDIICPGFSADCLETLEEINMENREIFLQHGGENYHYIPALNANAEHIEALGSLISKHCAGWPEAQHNPQYEQQQQAASDSLARAKAMGAEH